MVAFATIHRGMTRESQCVMETSHIQSGIPVTISFFQMMLNHKWLIWSRNQPGYDHWPPWIWSGRLAKECAYIGRCKRFTYPLGILQKAYYCHTSEPTIAWIQLRYGLCKHMKLMVVVANWFSTCLIWYFHWYSGFQLVNVLGLDQSLMQCKTTSPGTQVVGDIGQYPYQTVNHTLLTLFIARL